VSESFLLPVTVEEGENMRLLHDNMKKGRQMVEGSLLILSGVIESPGGFPGHRQCHMPDCAPIGVPKINILTLFLKTNVLYKSARAQ
jgi:hypothetical protein